MSPSEARMKLLIVGYGKMGRMVEELAAADGFEIVVSGGELRVFFVFRHARVLPLTYREPMRFETMPSRSIQHA